MLSLNSFFQQLMRGKLLKLMNRLRFSTNVQDGRECRKHSRSRIHRLVKDGNRHLVNHLLAVQDKDARIKAAGPLC